MKFLERIVLYSPDDFPVDIDVFPYTLKEVKGKNIPLINTALKMGKVLFENKKAVSQLYKTSSIVASALKS